MFYEILLYNFADYNMVLKSEVQNCSDNGVLAKVQKLEQIWISGEKPLQKHGWCKFIGHNFQIIRKKEKIDDALDGAFPFKIG